MNGKKKIIISLSIMAVVAVIALVAVVGVLAAGQQTLSSMINVSYTAKDVSAIARAKYYVGSSGSGTSSGDFYADDGVTDFIEFVPQNDGSSATNLNPPADMTEFEIYAGDKIAFEYIFQNTSPATYINVGLTLTDEVNSNMLLTYTTSGTALNNKFSASSSAYQGVYIAPLSTVYTYIVLDIDDESENAEFSANVNWNLEAMTKDAYDAAMFPGTIDVNGVLTSYTGTATNVVIPEGVTSIGSSAFNGCTSLTSVSIPSSVTSIGGSAFRECTSLTSIEIPSSVTSIGNSAFRACTSLTSIEIPTSVTSIGSYVFEGCTSLTSVTIPTSVTSIGYSAFNGCTSLTSVSIPSSVTSIDSYAFNGCTSLTSVSIPSSVTSIGSAFSGCTSLTSVSIPSTLTRINYTAFSNTPYLTNNTNKAIQCGDDANKYIFIKADTTITSTDSIANWDKVVCIGVSAFEGCTSLTSVTIPSGVTSIENGTFYQCTNLQVLTFENDSQLVNIGKVWSGIAGTKGAFAGCSNLTNIDFPQSLNIIGEYAFSGCTSLHSITFPAGLQTIDRDSFRGCTSLTTINWNATKLTSSLKTSYSIFYNAGKNSTGITVNIGESVEELPAYLFYVSSNSYRPNITSVVLPSGSTWIRSTISGATTGTAVDVDSATLATNLKDSWKTYYLIRTDN